MSKRSYLGIERVGAVQQHQVLRLDVAMDHPFFESVLEAVRRLPDVGRCSR